MSRHLTVHDVTLSTKCWEGDYRKVLSPDGLVRIFGTFGDAQRRQVAINRVQDRESAERAAAALVAAGLLDAFFFVEDHWSEVAASLGIPTSWFGLAWPYSAPELVELFMTPTAVIAHVAGDVALEDGPHWLPRALQGLEGVRRAPVVAPLSPSGLEVQEGRDLGDGWVTTTKFSDQCFVGRPSDLLKRDLVRSVHWSVGRYPKPGGALTFEARVAAWLTTTGQVRATDTRRSYVHPVWGAEGDSYGQSAQVAPWLDSPPVAGSAFPPARSVNATGLIIVRNGERTIGPAVRSLQWCTRVLVIDQMSEDRTAAIARATGAEVVQSAVTGVVEPARRAAVAAVGEGWVVMLDADEMLTGPLATRLVELMANGSVCSGVVMARKNMILGRWAAGAGWWPDGQLRAFRAESVLLPTEMHGAIELAEGALVHDLVGEGLARPELAILHFNYATLEDWFSRANRYTSVHGTQVALEHPRAWAQFLLSFTDRYLKQQGWRMGRYGFTLSGLGAFYDWLLFRKTAEYARGGATAVTAAYEEQAFTELTRSAGGGPRSTRRRLRRSSEVTDA